MKQRFKNKGAFLLAGALIFLGILAAGGLLIWLFPKGVLNWVLAAIDYFLQLVLIAVNKLFAWTAGLFAWVIDIFIILNPFDYGGAASFLWEFSKNLAYVILIFLALYSGIQWILNKEDDARRILFGVLIIAFLINFTFFLTKEIFYVTTFIQKALLESANLTTPNGGSKFGDLLHSIFLAISPSSLVEAMKSITIQFSEDLPEDERGIFQRASNVASNLVGIVLAVTFTLVLGSFAGIAVAKYFIISFLVGILPLAVIAKATPGFEKNWNTWWNWFLTWNFNFLILIILVLIGVALAATTTSGVSGAFSVQNIHDLMMKGESEWLNFWGLQQQSKLAYLFAFLIRFAFLAIYFILIIVASLRLGSKAAEYGYKLTLKGWGLVGAAATGAALYAARPGITKLGGFIGGMGDELLASRWGLLRGLGIRFKTVGEALQKPHKARIEEEAKQIWGSLMEGKSPEEILKVFQNYRGDLRKELAKQIGRGLSSEDLIKFASGLNLTKEDLGILRALCQPKLKCALTSAKEGKGLEALVRIGDSVDWRRIQLADINKLLGSAGIEEKTRNQLLSNYLANYATNEELNRIFAHPENLKLINETLGISVPGSAYERFARRSPAFRSLEELAEGIVKASNIPDNQKDLAKNAILRGLQSRYLGGNLTAENIRGLREQVQSGKIERKGLIEDQTWNRIVEEQIEQNKRRIEAEIERADPQLAELERQKRELEQEINRLEQELNQELSQRTPDVSKTSEIRGQLEALQQQKSNIEAQIANRPPEIQQKINQLRAQLNELENLKQQLQQLNQITIQEGKQKEVVGTVEKIAEVFSQPWGRAARIARRREEEEEAELEELKRRMREIEEREKERETKGTSGGS